MPPSPVEEVRGFWGPPTSSIDWCERNYEVTYFIAEFWNTVSNLAFIIPPLVVAYQLRGKVDGVYLASLIYMAFTGMGSFAFHGTLLYSMQLWDELSMVWSGLFILYLIIKILAGDAAARRYVLPLVAYGIGTCAVYLSSQTPIIFQVAYGVIHFAVVISAFKLRNRVATDMRLYWATVVMSSVGFLLWNLDNNMCPSLERLRSLLRSSISTACLVPGTQFHALWHCLAGYGAFCMVLYVMQARLLSLGKRFPLSRHPLSGLTLQQVQPECLMTSSGQRQGYADEAASVTHKDHSSSSGGTVKLISSAVSSGCPPVALMPLLSLTYFCMQPSAHTSDTSLRPLRSSPPLGFRCTA